MIMIFILATFILHFYYDWKQGPIAEFKCKQWWIDNGYVDKTKKSKYDNDYRCALMVHAWLWSLLIVLPGCIWWYKLGLFNNGVDETLAVILGVFSIMWINLIIHYEVDDMKANFKEINLWTDQIIHIIQVIVTIILLIIVAVQNTNLTNVFR